MTQRDLIKDQIEKLGQVLGQIIGKLTGLDTADYSQSIHEEVENIFRENTGLELFEVVLLPQIAFSETNSIS